MCHSTKEAGSSFLTQDWAPFGLQPARVASICSPDALPSVIPPLCLAALKDEFTGELSCHAVWCFRYPFIGWPEIEGEQLGDWPPTVPEPRIRTPQCRWRSSQPSLVLVLTELAVRGYASPKKTTNRTILLYVATDTPIPEGYRV